MKRLIHTADWHLRKDKPRCRLEDDWEGFQRQCVAKVVNLANEYGADLSIGGDLFHRPIVPDSVKNMFLSEIKLLEGTCYILPGNHDLKNHSVTHINDGSFGTVWELTDARYGWDRIRTPDLWDGCYCSWTPFGISVKETPPDDRISLLFQHRLVFGKGSTIPPNSDGITASDLLKELPGWRIIAIGDNHRSFLYHKNGRYVVNPGCLNRQAADLMEYNPIVYLIDIENNEIDGIYELEIGDTAKMVTDSYIREQEDREARIEAFIETVATNKDVSMDFEDNVRKAVAELDDTAVANIINTLFSGE